MTNPVREDDTLSDHDSNSSLLTCIIHIHTLRKKQMALHEHLHSNDDAECSRFECQKESMTTGIQVLTVRPRGKNEYELCRL